MSNKTRYIIESVRDKDNIYKANVYGGKHQFIKHLKIGSSAVLIMDDDRTIVTSTVEDIHIWENNITITTRNSEYFLVPISLSEVE